MNSKSSKQLNEGVDQKNSQVISKSSRPNYILYEQLISGCLDKIRKTIPRKCKELKDMCGDAIEQVKADGEDEILSANKYFRIFKIALDTKIPRLTEQILYHIQKLIAHGLMDGNHPDDCLYTDDERPKSNGTLPRKLIDAIVDEVCKCTAERDQQVQLQVVRALLTIVATSNTNVHERSLLKVMSSLYYIHIACTNPINQNTAKASLIQMISIVFKKMEQHSGDFAESLKKLNSTSTDINSTSDLITPLSSRININGANQNTETQQQIQQHLNSSRNTGKLSEEQKIGDNSSLDNLSTKIDQNNLVTFSPFDQYAHVTLTFIVDSVCLHSAKTEEIEYIYQQKILEIQNSDQYNSKEEQISEQNKILEQMNLELQQVPLISVPKSSKGKKKVEGEEQQTKKAIERNLSEQIINEQGIENGKFGWCIACRKSANLYCKHSRHPVCSFECKQSHIKLLEEAQASSDNVFLAAVVSSSTKNQNSQSSSLNSLDEPHARDALLVFNKLCQLLQSKDLDRKLDNVYDVRKVLLGLDLIHSCLENPGYSFVNRKEFVNVIRESLCNALLKFAVSSEHKIFTRTVSIFYCLFLHFREHLKQTIGVLIDNFFLRMLDSGNSEYDYKYSILDFFDRISENSEHVLEIFANYDCDIGQKDICVRIIESISGIAQGRFQRSEHTNVVTPQQEQSLRRHALEILVKILRNINRTIDTTVKLEAITRARLAESRQEQVLALVKSESASDSFKLQQNPNQILKQESSDNLDNQRQSSSQELNIEATQSMDAKQQIQNRVYKSEMCKAAEKFNLKPKSGIKYLQDKGYVAKEPKELMIKGICKFLKETSSLSTTAIGQFLGEDKEINKLSLSQYMDDLDFTNPEIGFFEAMKIMLTGFRIPGEGQQVDRFMEKFGEKLSKDRPEDFGNAEGVYLLAYATLMLQTSIHNPNAQKLKMTLADFKKITKTVKLSDTKEIDYDVFITELFEKVKQQPFTLEEDEDARMKLEASTNTNKKLLFDKEREGILRRGANMLKQDQRNNKFVLIRDISTILPMFENTWSANLAVFSVVLDETEDSAIADLCLQGFIHAIRISGHYEIHEVRNAFVSSLSKFTQVSASREIKEKNINCIRELLNLAIHDGDCLMDSWSYVLECISKIDQMRVLGLGELTDSDYFQSDNHGTQNQNQQINHQLLLRNSAIIAEQIDGNQIEQIFLQSERLNPNAIIDFIENLCKVSKDELADEDSPKKFCLQKLVEVASLNMNRVRFQWQSIWGTIGDHFTWVGSHKNLNVVIYAIDSLRQLSDKFLEKEERKNFSFQRIFLKPFETIMLNNLHSSQKEIKEYIVMCISALCHQKAKYIKSGWEVILNIFSLAAQDTETHLVVQSFQSLEHAVINYFELLEENFIELVNCLTKFSKNGPASQTTKVLSLISGCADKLRTQPQIIEYFEQSHGQTFHQKDLENKQRIELVYGIQSQFLDSMQKQVPGSQQQEQINQNSKQNNHNDAVRLSVLQELWFPIFRNYSGLIMEKNEEIRNNALDALSKTLNDHHAYFGEALWREIFGQVLLPVLEDIRLQVELAFKKQNQEQAQNHLQTLQLFLEKLNQFFIHNFKSLGPNLLVCYTDVLCLFVSKINNKELSIVTMTKLKQLLLDIGKNLTSPELWSDIVEQIKLLYEQTVPKLLAQELKSHQNGETSQILSSTQQQRQSNQNAQKFEQSYAKCTSQLQLTLLVNEIMQRYFDCFSISQIRILLQRLDYQYKFSIEFNSEMNLRFALWEQGYMAQLDYLPGLLALEEESLKAYLGILFQQYFKANNESDIRNSENDVSSPLFALCSKVLKDYVLKHCELVSINASKRIKGSKQTKSIGQNQLQSVDEHLSDLHEKELEKQLSHLGPIIHQVILENLMHLLDEDLAQQSKDLGQLLIDLTLCDDFQVRTKNHKLLTKIFEQYQIKQKI